MRELGQVFSPKPIVNRVLDMAGYKKGSIINKSILEPSFGDGAFILEIVERLYSECVSNNFTKEQIQSQLNNIVGYEIDKSAYDACIRKLHIAYPGFTWNLFLEDALDAMGTFDFVVGNPPYVAIKNMDEASRLKLDRFQFSQNRKNLYVSFFELGLRCLKSDGCLCYITPNTYLKNSSQKVFREYLINNRLIEQILDFKEHPVFDNVDTYTCITKLSNNNEIFRYTSESPSDSYCRWIETSQVREPWRFLNDSDQQFIDAISKRNNRIGDLARVQHGLATNCDSVFICKSLEQKEKGVLFNGQLIESEAVCRVAKASTFNGFDYEWVVFPYEGSKCEVIPEEKMISQFPLTYKYLASKKDLLKKRKGVQTWYAFGRKQGFNFEKKIAISNIIKDKVRVNWVDEGALVYSKLFITCANEQMLHLIYKELSSSEFLRYCQIVGKDLAGGYKEISKNDIENYTCDILSFG